MTCQEQDIRWMRMALSMGKRNLGRTWPNPSVGCVIVKDGRVLGRGVTAKGGRPHAEPQALAQAGEAARGATAYVTLEPCSHFGKAPPCVHALITAQVACVVIALQDPDTRVNGNGIAQLKAAGIEVRTGVLKEAAKALHTGFLSRVKKGRPHVTLKLATSLDGRIATKSGDSQWITGPLARRHVHSQRSLADAVLIGAGTARADDPSLTVRGLGDVAQPLRIVLSEALNVPINCQLTNSTHISPVWYVHGPNAPQERQDALRDKGAGCILVQDYRSPDAIFSHLAQEGLTSIYCEGGGQLAASLLKANLIQELHLYTGGKLIGSDGVPATGALELDKLIQAPEFNLIQELRLGPDLIQKWRRASC